MKIIGHEGTKKIIRLFLDKNYTSYSFLFEGKDCIGKKMIALLTARAFLCQKNQGLGCGECKDCKLANNLFFNLYENKQLPTHPDIKVITSEKEIKIGQIREIIDFLKHKSKKVVIIEKAERMNIEASNALLKTLEEPPKNSLIILTTSNQNAILPTILSRCKKIKFKPLKKEEIQQILALNSIDEKMVNTALALSDGSMCIPAQIIKEPKLFKYARDLFNILTLKDLHPEGVVSLAEIFEKLDNEEINKILDIVEKIIYKKSLKGDIDFQFYDKFIKENQELKKSISKGVKKKLALEGLYFNLKA